MRRFLLFLLFSSLLLFFPSRLHSGEKTVPSKALLVVYDFESRFDEGSKGRKVCESIRGHLRRRGLFTQIDPFSFEEMLKASGKSVTGKSSAEEVAAISSEVFGADIVIWGEVEKEGESFAITFRWTHIDEGKPVEPNEVSVVAPSLHEIQIAVDECLDKMLSVEKEIKETDPTVEKRWKSGPNLIKNGDMEKGKDFPEGFIKQHDVAFVPDIEWVADPDRPGKCIRFGVPKYIAETYGVLCYSPYFEIERDATYRASVDVKTLGPVPKIFVKTYAEISPGDWREVYRYHKYRVPATETWKTFVTHDFCPTEKVKKLHHRYIPTRGRVMLYAYLRPGEIYFDNIVVKRVK